MLENDEIRQNAERASRLFDNLRQTYSLEKIERLRVEKGISKADVAKAAGLVAEESAYDTYFIGLTKLDSGLLVHMSKVAQVLGVSLNDLKE